jgi:hypothetical protein
MTHPRRRRSDAGVTSLVATFLAFVLAGLSIGMVTETRGARGTVLRQETSCKALEIAEAGVCRAECEIRPNIDSGTDGIGVVQGSYAGGTYATTVLQDPLNRDRCVVRSRGGHGHSVRRIEVGLRRRSRSYFVEGLFTRHDLQLQGAIRTDGYDSRLGTYASQAVNVDAAGTYALARGDIGSNEGIDINGTSAYVRGNAIPGPGFETEMSSAEVILGDTLPREDDVPLPAVPLSTFEAALATNDNGNWSVTGGGLLYNSARYSMRVNAGATLTLLGGTYFFSDFVLRAGAVLVIAGPCKIYTTGSFDLSGGTLSNPAAPGDFQVYSAPYALPAAFAPAKNEIKLAGSPACAAAIYAPDTDMTIAGGSDFFGAIVARQVVVQGNPYFHYDIALEGIRIDKGGTIERLYWREPSPPLR